MKHNNPKCPNCGTEMDFTLLFKINGKREVCCPCCGETLYPVTDKSVLEGMPQVANF